MSNFYIYIAIFYRHEGVTMTFVFSFRIGGFGRGRGAALIGAHVQVWARESMLY